jgi:hypothetical protein
MEKPWNPVITRPRAQFLAQLAHEGPIGQLTPFDEAAG